MNYIYTLKDFRCDKHCPYCITKILNKVTPEDIHNFESEIDEIEGEYHYFILSGNGEPSLYPLEDLKMIRDKVESCGKFKEFRIQTSGILFNQPKKLALFGKWWKEITIVSPDGKQDIEFFNYRKEYFSKVEGRDDVRCNYTLLLSKFNDKSYLEDIKELVKRYKYVALKLLDTQDPWVLKYGVPYSFKDYLLEDLKLVLGTPVYDHVGCRYHWKTSYGKVTMSYGKEKGHDNIQIENIGGRKKNS
jgi:organic radical activating enzyme